MTKTLVLAEKPSVARDIARVLGARGGGTAQGFIESDEWVISWALGHLVALCEPDAIDPRFKPWRMDTLPILPESIPLHVLDKTKKQFAVVKKAHAPPRHIARRPAQPTPAAKVNLYSVTYTLRRNAKSPSTASGYHP